MIYRAAIKSSHGPSAFLVSSYKVPSPSAIFLIVAGTAKKQKPHFFLNIFFPEKDTLFWFKVLNSLWMGPYMIYFSMVNWIYPLKDYLGETGCYLMNVFRGAHLWQVQQQSFFISMFRFVFLFHGHILQKFNLSPNVSAEWGSPECKCLYMLCYCSLNLTPFV